MNTTLEDLFSEINDNIRNITTGSLDNLKRVRAVNWVLQDLQSFGDWNTSRRTKEFEFIGGLSEYSLKNLIETTALANDGSTDVSDFKNPYDLRIIDEANRPFEYRDIKDVRSHIQNRRVFNEYGRDGDLLIINHPKSTSNLVHNCDSLTANGIWTASGNASNLTIDEVVFKQGSGSLNFDSAGTSLILTNTTLSPSFDLSTLENKSTWLVWVYLPTLTNFSSVGLRWGGDVTTNYWEKTETARASGESLQVGWNQFAFRWADATPSGTPVSTAIDSLRVEITYSSSVTDTDFRVDDIKVSKTKTFALDYYSHSLVQTTGEDRQVEFEITPTLTDELLGGLDLRNAVVLGSTWRLFKMIGGKRERDEVDAKTDYLNARLETRKKVGHRLRRPIQKLKFPSRGGGFRVSAIR